MIANRKAGCKLLLTGQSQFYGSPAGYDRSHARWLRHAGGEAQCAMEGAATALLQDGMAVLDAACGNGAMARRMLAGSRGAIDLTLLDLSRGMLDACRDVPAQLVEGSLDALPFADGGFDLVTCAWGIETLAEPGRGVEELLRVTKRGGAVCLVFCADLPANSLVGAAMRFRIMRQGWGRFLNRATVSQSAQHAGASHIQTLFSTGPATAMILKV